MNKRDVLIRAATLWNKAAYLLKTATIDNDASEEAYLQHQTAVRELSSVFGSVNDPRIAHIFPKNGKTKEADIKHFESAARRAVKAAQQF